MTIAVVHDLRTAIVRLLQEGGEEQRCVVVRKGSQRRPVAAKERIGGESTSGHDLGFSQRRERGRGKRGGIENVLVTANASGCGGELVR